MRFSIENGNGFKYDVCKKELRSKDAIHINAKILSDSTGANKVISRMDMCYNCYIDILSKYALEPRGKNKVHWSNLEKIRKRCGYLNSEIPTEVQTTMSPVTAQNTKPIEKCKWIKYDYQTICPKEHIDVDSPYWRIPEDKMKTLKYCPYCGRKIEVEL